MSPPQEGHERNPRNAHSASELLTVAQVAALLHVSTETVRRWIRRGELPAFHIGRTIRIQRSDILHRLHD